MHDVLAGGGLFNSTTNSHYSLWVDEGCEATKLGLGRIS